MNCIVVKYSSQHIAIVAGVPMPGGVPTPSMSSIKEIRGEDFILDKEMDSTDSTTVNHHQHVVSRIKAIDTKDLIMIMVKNKNKMEKMFKKMFGLNTVSGKGIKETLIIFDNISDLRQSISDL